MTGNISVEFEGAHAVDSTREALSGLDVEHQEVRRVSVEVELGDPQQPTDDAPEEPTRTDGVGTYEEVGDGVQMPVGQIKHIREGTHDHIALVSLVWYLEDNDDEWAGAPELADSPFAALTEQQYRNALSRLFREKHAVKRKQIAITHAGGGRRYVHSPTTEGEAKAETLGQWDVDEE